MALAERRPPPRPHCEKCPYLAMLKCIRLLIYFGTELQTTNTSEPTTAGDGGKGVAVCNGKQ